MKYNSLGMFIEKNLDKILPQKGDLSPKNFSSGEETDTVESHNWVSYCNNWQSYLKQVLNNLCEDVWGSGFSVQVLFTVGSMGRSDKLSIWVVPTSKTVGQFI